ncbi:MAG: SDR family NAD(P)-dependent oxidoreductase [Rhizobiales bacterium]|nr:SDR family NAD(P)-dependent oxidoreductase [Hyphomicrobiales bacterium]
MTGILQGKTAVVTGASRGIGYAVSKALAAQGAHIIAVARTIGGLEELDDEIKAAGGSATLVPLDLKDADGLDRMGAALFERWKKLDIVVANAGILGRLTPLGHLEPKEWDEVMAVNVTANWRLIRSFDPLLRASDGGRAVFITSAAASACRAYWGSYSVTKAALDALAKTYAAECNATNVKVNLVNPGPLRTALRAQAWPGEDAETVARPAEFAEALIDLVRPETDTSGAMYAFENGTLKLSS